MRAASGALGMDSAGRTREAYVEYLRSITLIAQALQEEAAGTESSEGVTPDTPKLLKLAEQCLERVKSIAAALGKAPVKAAAQERGGGPAPLPRHRRVCSDEGGKLSPFLPPEIFQKLQIAEAQSARKELTPLEEASLQNQKLKAAYEARVARLNPNQAVQKTSLTLSLQRQMMENLVIAKAREETLQRKMEERRLRLQEAANRRFSSSVALTPEEQEQRALYAAILEYEQDHDWPRQWKAQLKRSPADLSVVSGLFSCLLSCPEHPITQLLRRLQCAVYARLYPAVSRGPADASPASPSALSFLSLDAGGSSLPAEPGGRRLRASRSLHCMFSVPEHGPALRHSQSSTPLADSGAPGPAEPPEPPRESSFEDLERFLASPEGWAPAEPPASSGQDAALPELLKGVVRDIHNAIDRLLALTLLAFEGLGTAAGKDQCLACLEEAFFPPLWAPLLALYRSVQQPREAALARSMERHRHAGPADVGLASRLFPAGPGRPAYASAVQDLRLIPLESCPRRKLECIVRALRGICECAEEYCGTRDARSLATAAIRPAAHPVLRGAADGAAPAALRVCSPGGVHPRGVPDRGGGVLPDVPAERPVLRGVAAVRRGRRGTPAPPGRMCAGSAPRQEPRQDYGQEFRQEFYQEYRRSLERELGPAGSCPGPAVAERLRQRLQQEPALLEALQEDALALLARGLRDHPDPGLALRGLASAFRLLELAAVNLYLFPWRREFGTIPVRPWGGVGTVWGYPDTSSHAPRSPCRPSPAPTCTCCARRSPKPTWSGVWAGWATSGGTGTAWPWSGGPRGLRWSLLLLASWPAAWSVRSWQSWRRACGAPAPRSCWRRGIGPGVPRGAWRCCRTRGRGPGRLLAAVTAWISTGRGLTALRARGARTQPPQRCGGTLRMCPGGAGDAATARLGQSPWAALSRTPPLASSRSPGLAPRPRQSCPATSCTRACSGACCPRTAAARAGSCTAAAAPWAAPAAAGTAGRSCAGSGSSASGCSAASWTCCWPRGLRPAADTALLPPRGARLLLGTRTRTCQP
ncbi:VPS9 domain-containing protein 1-like isoform X2 [Passer montanus]|uniref:VPS9 domain-containing protein 1-like isoform X2 n=1 Tax=Passer montanus TaxID=9160 RepID=UPI00195FD6F1|nr:VPS9 domain-containing protein 1-like isoform X2 [Passer montanus]